MDYREADDRVFEIMQAGGAAMFGFYAKVNLLKTALFDMVDSENPYAFKVLFRCLCEHHLKFMYVWTRFLREKNDDVGTEYFTCCGVSELNDYAAALVLSQSLLGRSVAAKIEETIAKGYPAAASMTPKEVERGAAKFRYRAILRFLSEQMPGAFASDAAFLPSIVPAYEEAHVLLLEFGIVPKPEGGTRNEHERRTAARRACRGAASQRAVSWVYAKAEADELPHDHVGRYRPSERDSTIGCCLSRRFSAITKHAIGTTQLLGHGSQ
jgi:hypothetical protein